MAQSTLKRTIRTSKPNANSNRIKKPSAGAKKSGPKSLPARKEKTKNLAAHVRKMQARLLDKTERELGARAGRMELLKKQKEDKAQKAKSHGKK